MRKLTLLAAIFSCVAVFGCDKKSEEDSTGKSGGEKSAGAESDKGEEARPAEEARPRAAEVKLVEYDLSSQGDDWKGFTVKGVEGAKVMGDLGNVRVASKGFNLILSQKKVDFEKFKKNKGIGVKKGKGEFKATVDKPDHLEWTAKYPNFTTYGFRTVVDVNGKKIGCWNMHGVNKKEKLEVYKKACKTIAKK